VPGRILDAEHARNFLDCVRSRKRPSCDVEFGHRATTAPLLANIAHRTRAYLEWDAKAERFTNHEAANRLLSYEYRPPYRLPG
jgi:Oxidoreductase family, C-terminal alpha/beta domain